MPVMRDQTSWVFPMVGSMYRYLHRPTHQFIGGGAPLRDIGGDVKGGDVPGRCCLSQAQPLQASAMSKE